MHRELKGNFEQTAEWLACLRLLVFKVNAGAITLTTRLRGATKDKMLTELAAAKRKAVIVCREEAIVVDDKYRAKVRTIWERDNPGKKPEDDHLMVKFVNLPGRWVVECVLASRLNVDEFDVNIRAAIGVRIEETQDDGSCNLRQNQRCARCIYDRHNRCCSGAKRCCLA